MRDYYLRAAVQTAGRGGALSENDDERLENIVSSIAGLRSGGVADAPDRPVTVAELQQVLRSLLSGLRVYVLESDITSSQNSVRTIVEQSKF